MHQVIMNLLSNALDALALKRAGDDSLMAELLCDLGEARVKGSEEVLEPWVG